MYAVKKFLEGGYQVVAVDHTGSHLSFAEGNPLFALHAVDLSNESALAAFVQKMITK